MEIDELIKQKIELSKEISALEKKEESIKAEIKLYMKTTNQNKYEDSSGNIVTLREQTRENLDKARIKELLGEIKFAEVIKKSSFDVLKVISAENREKNEVFSLLDFLFLFILIYSSPDSRSFL